MLYIKRATISGILFYFKRLAQDENTPITPEKEIVSPGSFPPKPGAGPRSICNVLCGGALRKFKGKLVCLSYPVTLEHLIPRLISGNEFNPKLL